MLNGRRLVLIDLKGIKKCFDKKNEAFKLNIGCTSFRNDFCLMSCKLIFVIYIYWQQILNEAEIIKYFVLKYPN